MLVATKAKLGVCQGCGNAAILLENAKHCLKPKCQEKAQETAKQGKETE